MGCCGCCSLLPAFAKESACSFNQILQWAGIQCSETCMVRASPVNFCTVQVQVRWSEDDSRFSVMHWQSVRKTMWDVWRVFFTDGSACICFTYSRTCMCLPLSVASQTSRPDNGSSWQLPTLSCGITTCKLQLYLLLAWAVSICSGSVSELF